LFRRSPVRRGTFDEREIEEYVQALKVPGALSGALNYYRANFRPDAMRLARSAPVTAETLVIWGDRDPALSTALLRGLDRVVPRVRIHRIGDASHWVQNEAPDEVNQLITDFLG
jgi:pimeloyl-ACP methyl ester carboxylesterase